MSYADCVDLSAARTLTEQCASRRSAFPLFAHDPGPKTGRHFSGIMRVEAKTLLCRGGEQNSDADASRERFRMLVIASASEAIQAAARCGLLRGKSSSQ